MKKYLFLLFFFFAAFTGNAQNVGIGVTTPLARLHITDSSVLFSASGDIPAVPGNTPISGAGRRMMWYPNKAAFRVGYVDGVLWDQANIGRYSFAAGINTRAFGNSSTALGFYSNASGDYSFAAGSSEALGINSVSIGSSLASSDYATAIGSQNWAEGYYTTALGFNSIAAHDYAMSFGYSTSSLGPYSTSLGVLTTASGNSSFSAGILSKAFGSSSVAIGHAVYSRALGAVALGLYNDTLDTPDPSLSNTSDRIFQLGNGTNPTRKNAITVLRNGRTGIGSLIPLARLHVADSSVLFSATGLAPVTPANPPISGEGRRMMWYPDKAAFRAGYVYASQWDINNVGNYSIAMGYSPTASGEFSTAMGYSSSAIGTLSTAIGASAFALGNSSTAIGTGTYASANNSTAIGEYTTAKSAYETVMGRWNTDYTPVSTTTWNSADRLFSIGNGTGSVSRSDAMVVLKNGNVGIGTSAPGTRLHIVQGSSGYTGGNFPGMVLEGNSNTYFNLLSPNSNETAILFGKASDAASGGIVYNNAAHLNGMEFRTNGNSVKMVLIDNGSLGVGVSDPAFRLDVGDRMRIRSTVGNSAGLWLNDDINTTSPAFIGMRANDEVGFYGQTGTAGWRFYINTTTGNGWMQGTLTQASDARLKKDITPLQNPLQKIIQLNGYTYHWKDEQLDKSLQTGVLAQEVQKLFPQLVNENKDGMLSVNYSGLIPVMIESIKEQQLQIDELKKMMQQLLEKKN